MAIALAGAKDRLVRLSPKGWLRIGSIALFLLTCLLYTDVLFHQFITDDYAMLAEFRFQPPSLTDNLGYFVHDWGVNHLFYRPLVRVLWSAEYALFRENPFGWHAIGVGLYALNVVLVLRLAYQLTKRLITAGLAGFLFMLLPTHAEPAIWVADQSDLLALGFCLAAFIAYLRARETDSKHSIFYLTLALIWFGLALLSKESALPFVGVLVWYELVFSAQSFSKWGWLKSSGRQILARLGAFVLLTVIFLAVRTSILGGLGGYGKIEDLTRPKDPLEFGLFYLGALLRPLILTSNKIKLIVFIVVVGLLAAVWWQERIKAKLKTAGITYLKLRLIVFGIGWAAIFMLPAVLTFLSLRFVYFSSVGIVLAVAALLQPDLQEVAGDWKRRIKLNLLPILQIVILGLVAILAIRETRAFQRDWHTASQTVPAFISQLKKAYPQIEPYSVVYIKGFLFPYDYDKDVPALHLALNPAIQLAYNDKTIETVLADEIKIREQRLNRTIIVEYRDGQIVDRRNMVATMLARNAAVKDKKAGPFLSWDLAGATQTNNWQVQATAGQINWQAGRGLVATAATGGIVRTPVFRLPAYKLGETELQIRADSAKCDQPLNLRWLIQLGDRQVERTGVPVNLICDGTSHAYTVKPPDITVFAYDDIVSQVQLELPDGLTNLEIRQVKINGLLLDK